MAAKTAGIDRYEQNYVISQRTHVCTSAGPACAGLTVILDIFTLLVYQINF